MTESTCHTQVDGAIGWIIFDNPRRHNAMSVAMWEAFAPAVDALQADPRVRVRVRGRWHSGTAHLLPEDDAAARLAALPKMNSAAVRAMGDNLLTIRIDLDR